MTVDELNDLYDSQRIMLIWELAGDTDGCWTPPEYKNLLDAIRWVATMGNSEASARPWVIDDAAKRLWPNRFK